jgi:hypothetical protein
MKGTRERGIRIPLARKSWDTIVASLEYLIDYPDIGELEESREEMVHILNYLRKKLSEGAK